MSTLGTESRSTEGDRNEGSPARVLVVEDVLAERRRLHHMLGMHGFRVHEAENGTQALEILDRHVVDIVISDWDMPEMNGVELCQKVRASARLEGLHFIILTGHQDRAHLVRAFQAGADDFLSKPVHSEELFARVRAGQRICSLRARLEQQLASAQQDLSAAGSLQQELLPKERLSTPRLDAAHVYLPATQLGGDMLCHMELADGRLGFFLLDVCGHGAASALLSFAVARKLIAELGRPHGVLSPGELLAAINHEFQDQSGTGRFFTAVLGCLDPISGDLQVGHAGHPPAVLLTAGGNVKSLDDGGLPLGVFPHAEYTTARWKVASGDRLFVYSDGLTEAENGASEQLGIDRVLEVLSGASGHPAEQIDSLCSSLRRWRGSDAMEDDVSALLINLRVP